MTVTSFEIRPGAYYDSVVLMQLQKGLAGLPGVVDAGVVMATPTNKEVLLSTGFDLESITAEADDLLIVVKADDQEAAAAALGQVDDLLVQRQTGGGGAAYRPKSLAMAARLMPEADWVLISVPGRFAAAVADEALDLDKHVFLYSDNVALEDEIRLKTRARQAGRLVMGPDCGTAIVSGAGLGFANRVRRGSIGLVAASGTGLQAVTAGIHNRGGGVSQALGTGGRDLKSEVGGATAHQGLATLAADPETEVIVLISKPPAAAIAAGLLQAAAAAGKPVVVSFIGYPPPARRLGSLHFAATLDEAAELAVSLAGQPGSAAPPAAGHPGYLRGLFSGGTLAYETMLALQGLLHPLSSNVPIQPEQQLADVWHSTGHTIVDLGEDDFTQGRLHPMMDNDLRLRRLRQEAADGETGLILLDVVLGEGAHPDPASVLAPARGDALAGRPELAVACLVVGTEEDPQNLPDQVDRLAAAGARVFRTVTEAAAYCAARLAAPPPPVPPVALFPDRLSAINVGLESFHDSLLAQGARVLQVDWRPPAGGNEKMMAILARLKTKKG